MGKGIINYEYKGVISKIFIPVILVLTILKYLYNMHNEFIFIIEILCLSISALIFIMSVVKFNNRKLGILNQIGVGCFFIAIFRFTVMEIPYSGNNNEMIIAFTQILTFLGIVNIFLSMLIYYKKYPKILHWIFFLLLILILYIMINDQNIGLDYMYLFSVSTVGSVIDVLSGIGIFILIIYLYKKFNLGNGDKWLLETSFFILLSNIFLFFDVYSKIDLSYFIWISKLISYFLLYNEFEKTLLNNIYSSVYESLSNAKEIKKNLNKSLKRREKELKELNLLLEKSEKNYQEVVQAFSKGLLLFENDILTYYSDFQDMVNIKNSKFKKNKMNLYEDKITLNEVLSKITGETYPINEEIKDFSTEIKLKDKHGILKDYEIYLIDIDKKKKILVFYDVTEIIKQREEIAKIEKKIKEENINDEFYSNISHELRTPINVIYSALQLNDIYLRDNKIDNINKNNIIVKQNCLRLIRTINNFIDSNKLSEGYLDINLNIYNIVEIIENIILSCDYYMKLKETMIIYDPKYEEVYLRCDKDYIERIMLNILSNSLKYGKYNGRIYVTINIEKENIVIEVINDAEAIPEEKRNVIFEKFTKVNTSFNRPSEGSGLGLFLTKGLVELHGGEITISAGASYGNIFRIKVPYDRSIQGNNYLINNNTEINDLKQKIDIEFSDIYF
ncbi:MAG: HAMP domain-containing histidine kinase [Clostridium sartagoforme]|nr:HAMP domain-containing histidine kinase [Clostridium sartagoforme]